MRKDLSYYLELDYPILIKKEKDSEKTYYEAEIPDLPGCGAYGESRSIALRRLDGAKARWLVARIKRNLPIPEPVSEDEFSGRILLRIPSKLHMKLTNKAKGRGQSLNQFLRNCLEESLNLEQIISGFEELRSEIDDLKKSVCTWVQPLASATAWFGSTGAAFENVTAEQVTRLLSQTFTERYINRGGSNEVEQSAQESTGG
jgi:antitoxin HicB